MKKFVYLSLICLGLSLGACNNGKQEEAKEFIQKFVEAVQQGNKEEIKDMYPGYTLTDSIAILDVSPESMEITPQDGNTFLVKLGDGIDMTIAEDQNGTMTIEQSHRLFAYEADRMAWAMKVGQFKPELDDVTNAARMRDNRFMENLKQELRERIKSGLSARCINGGMNESNYTVRWSLLVSNNNDFDVPGDLYQAKAIQMGWDCDRLIDVVTGSRICTGKPIPAGGSVTYLLGNEDFEYGGWKSSGITITDIPLNMLMTMYTPRGNEFDEFIKANGEATAVDDNQDAVSNGPLILNMSGIMGGCGTQLTFNATNGTLRYNPNGKKLNGYLEERSVSLVSYDPNSGKLVLQVQNGGTTTGNLDGKLKDGRYSGRFKNVNGKSSSFSFK